MADFTSTTSGAFSAGATWVGGVAPNPTTDNLKTITIANGHTVTYDVNNSAQANGWGLFTIVAGAELKFDTTTSCILKMGAFNISLNGTLRAGTSLSPYPYNLRSEIRFSTANTISFGVGNIQFWCAAPTIKVVKLSAPAALGATSLSVVNLDDSACDLRDGNAWLSGDRICVDNINKVNDSELFTLGTNPGASTITLPSGLVAAKIAGTLVILVSRSIRVTGSTTNHLYGSATMGASQVDCEVSGQGTSSSISLTYLLYNTTCNHGIICGTGGATSQGVYAWRGGTFNGIVTHIGSGIMTNYGLTCDGAIVSGCGNAGLYNNLQSYFKNCIVSGCSTALTGNQNVNTFYNCTIVGSTYGIGSGAGIFKSCTIQGNNRGIYQTDIVLYDCVVGGAGALANTYDVYLPSRITGRGSSLNSSTQTIYVVNEASSPNSAPNNNYIWLYDLGGVSGAFKGWMYAGTMQSATAGDPYFSTYGNKVIKYLPVTATYPLYHDIDVYAYQGRKITIDWYCNKTVNSMTSIPTLQIIDPYYDPNWGGTVLTSVAMADNTNNQTLSLSYTPTASTCDRILKIRVTMTNATGNLYSYVKVRNKISGYGGVI